MLFHYFSSYFPPVRYSFKKISIFLKVIDQNNFEGNSKDHSSEKWDLQQTDFQEIRFQFIGLWEAVIGYLAN